MGWPAVDEATPEVRGVGTDFGDLVEWEEEYASHLEFTSPNRQPPNNSTKLNALPTASQYPEGYTVPQQFPKHDRCPKVAPSATALDRFADEGGRERGFYNPP